MSLPEPAFTDLPDIWVSGLAVTPAYDLSTDPASSAHAGTVAGLAVALGLDGIAWARQVHGGEVRQVTAPGCAGEADALWTDRAGLGVMGRSADCPILLLTGHRADGSALWGMAHASWRSTVTGITSSLLAAMAGAGLDAATLRAAIAPSAGPCCYEVGEDVRCAALDGLGDHAAAFFEIRGDRLYFDLWAANHDALARAQVAAGTVCVDGRCTICGEGFPSYRREGERAGRFGVVLGCRRTTANAATINASSPRD